MFCYFFVIEVKTMHFSFRSFIIITFSKVGYFTDVIFSTRIVLTTILERKRADMASDVHHASIYVYIMAQRKQESSARLSSASPHDRELGLKARDKATRSCLYQAHKLGLTRVGTRGIH